MAESRCTRKRKSTMSTTPTTTPNIPPPMSWATLTGMLLSAVERPDVAMRGSYSKPMALSAYQWMQFEARRTAVMYASKQPLLPPLDSGVRFITLINSKKLSLRQASLVICLEALHCEDLMDMLIRAGVDEELLFALMTTSNEGKNVHAIPDGVTTDVVETMDTVSVPSEIHLLLKCLLRLMEVAGGEVITRINKCCPQRLVSMLCHGEDDVRSSTTAALVFELLNKIAHTTSGRSCLFGIGILPTAMTYLTCSRNLDCSTQVSILSLLSYMCEIEEGWSLFVTQHGEYLKDFFRTQLETLGSSYCCEAVHQIWATFLTQLLVAPNLKSRVSETVRTAYIIRHIGLSLVLNLAQQGIRSAARNKSDALGTFIGIIAHLCSLSFSASLITQRVVNKRTAGQLIAESFHQNNKTLDDLKCILKSISSLNEGETCFLYPNRIAELVSAINLIRHASTRRRSSTTFREQSENINGMALFALVHCCVEPSQEDYSVQLEAIIEMQNILRQFQPDGSKFTRVMAPRLQRLLRQKEVDGKDMRLRDEACKLLRAISFGHGDAPVILYRAGILATIVSVVNDIVMEVNGSMKKAKNRQFKSSRALRSALQVIRQLCSCNSIAVKERSSDSKFKSTLAAIKEDTVVFDSEVREVATSTIKLLWGVGKPASKKSSRSRSTSDVTDGPSKRQDTSPQRNKRDTLSSTCGSSQSVSSLRRTKSSGYLPACAESRTKVSILKASLRKIEEMENVIGAA